MNRALIVAAFLIVFMPGCATPENKSEPFKFTGLCGFYPLGRSEQGVLLMQAHCEADK